MKMMAITLLSLLFTGGCATTVSLSPASPKSSTSISAVSIEYDAALTGKKADLLNNYDIKGVMGRALQDSFQLSGNETLHVTITRFRTGQYGPTRMEVIAKILNESGSVVKETKAASLSSFGHKVQRVAQDIVSKIVSRL
ncbi:MAG: hypothetical protein GXP14_08100 [Gammaproteobacteria bacterium]|nr:hypothetical protein [Gammaproteobacteria bacterium]